jgi:hypothetical protein
LSAFDFITCSDFDVVYGSIEFRGDNDFWDVESSEFGSSELGSKVGECLSFPEWGGLGFIGRGEYFNAEYPSYN